MLTVEEVAHHWKLQPETIRRWIGAGRIKASRLRRVYRLNWQDVWACERGPIPGDRVASRYKAPLLSKDDLAAEYKVSIRTVERWGGEGLPTRNVFGAVRFNAEDVSDWLSTHEGFGPTQ